MWSSQFVNQVLNKTDKLSQEEIKRIILNLDHQQRTSSSILNSLPFAIILINPKSSVQYINKTGISILGVKGTYWKDKPLSLIIKNDTLKNQMIDALKYLGAKETKIIQINDTQYKIKVHPFVQHGLIRGNVIIMKPESLNKRQKQLMKQAQKLKSLSELLGKIAHEIKNPLTALDIHIQLIKQQIPKVHSKKVNNSLNIISEEVNRLNQIIQNFLSSLRPTKIKRHDIFLLDVLKQSILVLKPEFKKKHIHFKLDVPHNPLVYLDANYIQQLLLNLLKNSLDACTNGDSIILRSRVDGHHLQLDVIDSGIGIKDELKSQIFDPYFTTKNSGSGIGLTMVHQIVQEHQGHIDIESTSGKGTQVRLIFPNAISQTKALLNSPYNTSSIEEINSL